MEQIEPSPAPPLIVPSSNLPAFSTAPPADHIDSREPAPRPVWVRHLLTLSIWAFALWLLLYFFDGVKFVLLCLLATIAVASILRPLVDRVPGPRPLRGAVVGLGFLLTAAGVLLLLGWLLSKPIAREFKQWPQTRANLEEVVEHVGQRLQLRHTLTLESATAPVRRFIFGEGGGHVLGRSADILSQMLVALALVFVGNIYLLVEPEGKLMGHLLRMLPAQRRVDLQRAIDELEPRLRWWLIGLLISMTIIGVISWLGYWIVGLKFALPLALFAGLAEVVPNIGALTATLVAVCFAATQGTGVVIGVLVVHSITLFIESHVILPLVMRRAVHLPPVVTLFTVVLWAEVLGPGGLILALPLDLVIWTLAETFLMQPNEKTEHPLHREAPANTS